MATINDVSKRAGVSRSTVSRVIADNGYVSDVKRKAIETAIAELGYRPNTMARGLRSNRSNILGAVVVDVASPFYAQMVGGMQMVARADGRSVIVQSGFADQDQESRAISELLDRSCDGLILYLETPMRADILDEIARSRIPVVTVGTENCPVARVRISLDNVAGAQTGMKLLLDEGHRKIVHLSGGPRYRDSLHRLKGIAAALADIGLGLEDITVISGDFTEHFGLTATRELIASGQDFTAIFAGDDDIAAGALLALKEAGIAVPDAVSLLGFDDNFHARHLTPGLTTIRQPIDEAGRLAARYLHAILDGTPPAETSHVIPTELIRRDSVGPAPINRD